MTRQPTGALPPDWLAMPPATLVPAVERSAVPGLVSVASDVDVVFVGHRADPADEAAARSVMQIAGACFRVDADLRPEGRNGPLVRTLESYEAYWDKWAQTWEFQALLKARAAAGDVPLASRWLSSAEQRVWRRPFRLDDLRAVRAMKARA